MKPSELKYGDVCILDESVEYNLFAKEPYEVVYLWDGTNSQPLVTKIYEYKPFWTTYSQLTKVTGHMYGISFDLSYKQIKS